MPDERDKVYKCTIVDWEWTGVPPSNQEVIVVAQRAWKKGTNSRSTALRGTMYDFQCRQCSPGFVKTEPGDIPCSVCPDVSHAVNITTCIVCPDYATTRSGSAVCLCPAPYIWSSGVCTLCPEDPFGKLTHLPRDTGMSNSLP